MHTLSLGGFAVLAQQGGNAYDIGQMVGVALMVLLAGALLIKLFKKK